MAIGTATALALGTVGSSLISSGASSSASKKISDAATDSTALQAAIYEDTTEKAQPFYDAGTNAFSAYLSELGLGDAPEGYGGYEQSPMAQYLMQEGSEDINAAFASRGGYNSGAALEALEANRQSVISADTSDYFNRLLGVSQMGLDAATLQNSAGQSYANSASNNLMTAANASATATMGSANAMTSGIGDLAGIYGYFNTDNPLSAYANPMWS